MNNKKGKIIVIDGLDGSGKNTQAKIIVEKLIAKGKNARLFSFPNYESDSSKPVQMCLGGKISKNMDDINPYIAASLYAVDRSINFIKEMKKFLDESENNIAVCDRYISSNILHQSPRIEEKEDREDFIDWCYVQEADKFGVYLEDICIILSVHPDVSQKLMDERYNNDDSKKDIHESNRNYLKHCYDTMKESIDFIKNELNYNWHLIDCCDSENKGIRKIASISNDIDIILDKFLLN